MLPGTQQRKKEFRQGKPHHFWNLPRPSSSALSILPRAAALSGTHLKSLTVTMEREKPKEIVKPKPVEPPKTTAPKVDDLKPVIARTVEPPKEVVPTAAAAPAAVAPAAAEAPTFVFSGGRDVTTDSDPRKIYKDLIQRTLQLNWVRPSDSDDTTNVAEVEVAVDKKGDLNNLGFTKTSGQKKWDDSVRMAIASTPRVSALPPSNFPPKVVIRFDVQPLEAVSQ